MTVDALAYNWCVTFSETAKGYMEWVGGEKIVREGRIVGEVIAERLCG